MQIVNSSEFQTHHAIHISHNAAYAFNEYIRSRGYRYQYNVRILISVAGEEEMAVVVIPNHLNLSLFEKDLFSFKNTDKREHVKESLFWSSEADIATENKDFVILF